MMNSAVASKLPEIIELCRRRHVRRLDLFGSAASGSFDPGRSDLDFVVEFSGDASRGLGGDYFGLMVDLETLLGAPVDLIERGAIANGRFKEEVEESQVPVYAA
jgi:predicted nucleotidyltransferase